MKTDFEDYLIDAKLHIETVGRDDSFSTDHLPFGKSDNLVIAVSPWVIPDLRITVKNAGVIGTICVSGLPHMEDHKLIVDSLKQYLSK